MQVTDKQVEAALKQLPFDYPTTLQPYVVRSMIEAAMQAAPAVEQEPVGYVLTRRLDEMDGIIDCDCTFIKKKLMGTTDNLTPLYTHPQPKRKPLSESEIKQIFEQSIGLKYWDFAKAIEKAHGIGEE
jgi:hypothetical protein